MNYCKFVSIACIASFLSVAAIFEHDRAALAYQKGDYAQSRDLMQKALISHPDDPVCLYDSGVVAYKNNDLDQAQAYFSTVTQQPNIDAPLLEKAHFNRAKVYEKRDEYVQAVEQYNSVLQINPDNYKAQQEKARLEKLLEKKKQEQEQDQEKKQKQDSSKKDSQQQNNQDQQSSSQQDKQKDKQNQPYDDSQQKQRDKNRGEKSKSNQAGNENGQHKEAQQESLGNEKGTKKETEQTMDKQAEHAQSPEEIKNEKSIAEKKSAEQVKQADALKRSAPAKKMDVMLERILAEQEKNDACLNKQCIKATVKKNMAGRNDQNSW